MVATVVNQKALAPVVKPLLRIAHYAWGVQKGRSEMVELYYDHPYRAAGVKLFHQIRAERELGLGLAEAYFLFSAVKQTAKIPGDIAEVGVYQGGSSKLICEAKEARRLHLFDTFAGLPSPKDIDAGFSAGEFACSLDSVRRYLAAYAGVTFYPGLFPETTLPVSNNKFSFVHVDVDLYDSTRSCLEFFYPRMSPGGVILSHDYLARGVKAAFEEFLADRPEAVIELAGTQCMVTKIG